MIELTVKISLKTYRKLIYAITYKKTSTILVTLIGIFNLIGCVLYLTGPFREILSTPLVNLLVGLLLTFAMPLTIYFTTKKTFLTSKYLQEESHWTIDNEGIRIQGATFSAHYEWSFIQRLKQINNVVVIYHNETIANLIPFDAFKSYPDFEQFWKYVKANNVMVG